ncbi:hypothetical protein [Paenibacillus sp. GCM10023250]|uniref:hypothetical protein n=1 Tax=Paenibacillus sp. GCM10023250 TaxID=3252648 RepID=UPI003614D431
MAAGGGGFGAVAGGGGFGAVAGSGGSVGRQDMAAGGGGTPIAAARSQPGAA